MSGLKKTYGTSLLHGCVLAHLYGGPADNAIMLIIALQQLMLG